MNARAAHRGRWWDAALALLAGGSLIGAALLTPSGNGLTLGGARLGDSCWFHSLTGHDCPFCGMTRSFVALLHGDVAAAFRYHPAGPLLALALAAVTAAILVFLVRRSRPFVDRPRAVGALGGTAVIGLLLGLFRAL